MSEKTGISWTDHTFNPWWGCVKVSPACTRCYAERDAKRYGHDVWGPEAPRRFFTDKHWADPLKWNGHAERLGVRRRVFCASMADVFELHADPRVHAEMQVARQRLWRLIDATPALDWLLLTKRPENIARLAPGDWDLPRPNVWLGTTAENQEWYERRVVELLAVPAVVHFISYEPALGPLHLRNVPIGGHHAALGLPTRHDRFDPLHPSRFQRVDWLIAGGESGGGFRDAELEWYRSARDQCLEAGVAFWFKQHSGLHPKLLGDRLDGAQWHQVPGARP